MNNIYKYFSRHPFFLPTIVFLMLIIPMHFMFPIDNDDIYFRFFAVNKSLYEFILWRYETWTSRIFIETIIWILAQNWLFFILTNIGVYLLMYIFFMKLVILNYNYRVIWVCLALILSYPFQHMETAGYMATNLNYIWPMTAGFIALYGIIKSIKKSPIHSLEYAVYIVCLIVACNSEQFAVYMTGLLIFIIMYEWFINKKINIYIFTNFTISILMLLFALLTSSHSNRMLQETINWLPQYLQFGFLERIQFGYAHTLSHFIYKPNPVFVSLCLLMYVVVFIKYKNIRLYKLIAAIPLAVSFVFNFLPVNLMRIHYFGTSVDNVVNAVNVNEAFYYAVLFMSGFVILCVLASLYLCFNDEKIRPWLCALLLLLGLGTSLMMGFSPTVWASRTRPFLFAYFSMIACSAMIYQKIQSLKFKYEKWLFIILLLFGLYNFGQYYLTI